MRRESREKVFQTLFMMDALGVGPEEAIPLFASALPPPSDKEYYDTTVLGVWKHREEINGLIRKAAVNWRLERMTLVDRNILILNSVFTTCVIIAASWTVFGIVVKKK